MTPQIFCACGCGQLIPERDKRDKPRRFAFGHRMARPLNERFWAKVAIGAEDECWPWSGAAAAHGYGHVWGEKNKNVGAHRVSWELHNGPIPDGLDVLHRCDNPPCVNPAHLFLGTATDNGRDMVSKGRANTPRGDVHGSRTKPERRPRGEASWNARLNDDLVRFVRQRYAEGGISMRQLGARVGLHHGTIGQLVRRERWAHVQ